ncbi:MAG: porin [Deltaproteobacteria bacterium]
MRKRVQNAVALLAMSVILATFAALNSSAEDIPQLDAFKREIEEIRAETERQIQEIQTLNRRQIEALEGKIKALEAINAPKAEPAKPQWTEKVEAGYKDGIFIKTDNFSLKFNTLFQGQFFVNDFDSEKNADPDPRASFQIRRLRIFFTGNGFYPWLKYTIQLDADRGSGFGLRDAHLDFARYREATLRFGQYKAPFQREEINGDSLLQFADRSIVNEEFTLERDIGLTLYGMLLGDTVEYHAGVFNGAGRNAAQNLDENFLYVARAVFSPFGEYKYSQGHLEDPSKPLLAIGAAVAAIPDFNPSSSGQGEGIGSRANLARAVLDIDPETVEADVVQFTADLAFKYAGFSAEAEYDLRRISPDSADSATGHGFRGQIGYLILPPNVDVAFRYAIVDPNGDISNDKRQEFTPSVSYYFFGHRLKLVSDYSLLVEDNPNGGSFRDNRFRIGAQFLF